MELRVVDEAEGDGGRVRRMREMADRMRVAGTQMYGKARRRLDTRVWEMVMKELWEEMLGGGKEV